MLDEQDDHIETGLGEGEPILSCARYPVGITLGGRMQVVGGVVSPEAEQGDGKRKRRQEIPQRIVEFRAGPAELAVRKLVHENEQRMLPGADEHDGQHRGENRLRLDSQASRPHNEHPFENRTGEQAQRGGASPLQQPGAFNATVGPRGLDRFMGLVKHPRASSGLTRNRRRTPPPGVGRQ